MKKIISIILIMSALLSLASCKRKVDTETDALVDIETPATEEIEEEIKTETPKTETKTEEPKAETKTDTKKEETPKTETKTEVTQKEETTAKKESTQKEESVKTETVNKTPDTSVSNTPETKEETNKTPKDTPVTNKEQQQIETATPEWDDYSVPKSEPVIKETEDDNGVIISTDYPAEYKMSSAFKESSLIVQCQYIEPVKYVQLTPYGKGGEVFTDYKIKVTEVLRGDFKGTELLVRLPGGKFNGMTYTHSNQFSFAKERNYVLFLYQPDINYSSYYTGETDVYYLVHDLYGAFCAIGQDKSMYVNAKGNGKSTQITETYLANGNFINLVFTIDSFKEKLVTLDKELQFDPDCTKNRLIEYLEKGQITEQDLETYISKKEPATIICAPIK